MKKSYSQSGKTHSPEQWSEEQEAAFDEPPFAIYMSPTTDSLDDTPYSPGPDASATAPSPQTQSVEQNESRVNNRQSTPTRRNAGDGTRLHPRSSVVPQYPPAESPGSVKAGTPGRSSQASPLPPRPQTSPGKKRRKSAPRDFQHQEDYAKVTTRSIDLATRTAFEPIRPVSVEEWKSIADHVGQVRKTNMEKKLSPSLQHLELLHKMNSVTTIRHLDFSPSVGLESDVFVPWDEDLDGATTTTRKRRRRGKSKRDGRYRSIDPFKAVADALPQHPPLLSNRKYRLPMRSDVGFPNASEEDIIRKQQEIGNETEWEEASPRLVVLVTSDDIGTAFDEPPPTIVPQHEEWNGGGLEGIPFAGKELMMAKERNARLSKRPRGGEKRHSLKYKPNRTNMLAPPLEATYSSTLGWRPRPFNDLPPGMIHSLICPLNVQFDIGNIEPMVGSIALYCLPKDPGRKGTFGKMSEEFYFPVGMWKGQVSLEAARTLKGAIDHEMIEAWYGRKHKGLFPYDPMSVPWGTASLYLVLTVYKVPHANASGPYLESRGRRNVMGSSLQRSKSIGSRIKGSKSKRGSKSRTDDVSEEVDIGVAQARSNATFDSFRTQFLTPLCFGVSQLFPEKVEQAITEDVDDIMRLLDAANLSWPNGVTNEIELFAFPSPAMSQDDFVRHAATIANNESEFQLKRSQSPTESMDGRNASTGDLSYMSEGASDSGQDMSSLDLSSIARTDASSTSFSLPKGENGSLPSRKSFLKRSASKAASNPRRLDDGNRIDKIAGSATLFVSVVGNDFSQSMLHTPLELLDSSSERGVHSLPRLLVDVTGDCAIMMNPSASKLIAESSGQGVETGQRRSDLVRLPLSTVPSGYADASEVRQLLYLPPRFEKQFDVDPPSSFRSCLNLLYMYPRLLRIAQDADVIEQANARGHGKKTKNDLVSYSVRIQLVRSSVAVDKASGQMETSQITLESFHNPSPWAGQQMLQAIYTKPNEASQAKHVEHYLYNGGIPLRDEIKMRLPMVLDGSYFLQFTLFAVTFDDELAGDAVVTPTSGIAIDALAETTIPLSSSSNREPASGVRVTTVIPNGCHRVRLGDYQLHLETRLVSSIHVSDPTLGTLLRDFPYAKDIAGSSTGDKLGELALVPSRSVVGKALPTEPALDGGVPFHRLISTSRESKILGYFPLLVYMHLCNLVNVSLSSSGLFAHLRRDDSVEGRDETEASVKFAMENMTSLLEIFRKVKIELKAGTSSCASHKKVFLFVKNYVDNFDEASFLRWQEGSDSAINFMDGASSEKSRSSSSLTRTAQKKYDADDYSDESAEEDNVSLVAVRRRNDHGPLKNSSTFNASTAPFSRVAFGASKTDRMRVEAELYHQSSHFTHLFDDDETVVTNLYSLATPRDDSNAEPRDREFGQLLDSGFSLERADSIISYRQGTKGTDDASGVDVARGQGLNESGFVKRVRTAAQVMIAPCITPSLSSVLTGAGYSPKGAEPERERRKARMSSALKSRIGPSVVNKLKSFNEDQETPPVNVLPGTDTEEDTDAGSIASVDEARMRNKENTVFLSFTLADGNPDSSEESSSVPFIYEASMVIWLRSFVDHVANENKQDDAGDGEKSEQQSIDRSFQFCSLPEHAEISSPTTFQLFHSQMDILLPLCLKSFLLRCASMLSDYSPNGRILLDRGHMDILVPFVEMLTSGLVGEALAGSDSDSALLKAISKAEVLLDFLVGLASVLHPQHTSTLLQKHFKILRDCEIPEGITSFVWNKETLRRARCSRQLRLRSVERFSCMPNFVSINYPLKYVADNHSPRPPSSSWTAQSTRYEAEKNTTAPICPYPDGRERLPESGWLAGLLAGECLSITSLCCEAIVAEAMAHAETASPSGTGSPSRGFNSPSNSDRPGASLNRDDILLLQSMSIHSITCVYELLLRRHAMDSRFQKEQARSRIAALFAPVILEKSLKSTRWLARMEATHKARSTWLLCFIYIMQEAPESQLRDIIRSYFFPPDFLVQRFIRLLRLSSATFQSFVEQAKNSSSDSVLSDTLAPWLLQECFNTICAATTMLVDECAEPMSAFPAQERKMSQGILDLLLHVLTAPQSAVTHLRTTGAALQTLNTLGIENFLDGAGTSLQHWIRIMLTLMNSTSLSVRSMSVDFTVSLLGATFNLEGNIDEVSVVIATVLPEVAAREIGLYSVNGLIHSIEDVECSVWPLRRALADIEEANPLDDDRVDPFLSPLLSTLCRACQAIIDGVLIELRLTGSECVVVGSKVQVQDQNAYTFDADEESLYEAASFFVPETAPLQRLRWLFTLTRLHEAKGQWVEAAETHILCARTASDAIPHVKSVWRPSRFVLWYDRRRSLWLSTVGMEMGRPDRGHAEVMKFADVFLEPPTLVDEVPSKLPGTKLPQPTVQGLCNILTYASKQAVSYYMKEGGMEEIASSRLEGLLQPLMLVIDEHNEKSFTFGHRTSLAARKRTADEIAALRRASVGLNGELAKLAQSAVPNANAGSSKGSLHAREKSASPKNDFLRCQYYVRVVLSGKKPHRFLESTTIPTFLEWNNPCICRVARRVHESVDASGARDAKSVEERICREFGSSLRAALLSGLEPTSLMFRTGAQVEDSAEGYDAATTFLDVSIVHLDLSAASGSRREHVPAPRQSRHFFYRQSGSFSVEQRSTSSALGSDKSELLPDAASNVVELTVAHPFPCALSRQRTLVESDILASNPNEL